MKSSRRKLSLAFRRSSKAIPAAGSVSGPRPHAATPTSAFLLLPREIRDDIYARLFAHSTTPYRAARPSLFSHPTAYRRHIPPSTDSPAPHAICLACQQTYAEAHALFYALTVFDLATLPHPYRSIPALLAAPPVPLAALGSHLAGIPLQSLLAPAALSAFAALHSVSLTIPQRVIMHTMASPASSGIAAMANGEIYALLNVQRDWQAQQKALQRLLDAYPHVRFRCTVDVVCHENKRYSSDPGYDSFRLPCEYDPHHDTLVAFRDRVTKVSAARVAQGIDFTMRVYP